MQGTVDNKALLIRIKSFGTEIQIETLPVLVVFDLQKLTGDELSIHLIG
jgi:hypothetical protein